MTRRTAQGRMGILLAAALLALLPPGSALAQAPSPAVPPAQAPLAPPPDVPGAEGTLERARAAAEQAGRVVEEIFRGQSLTLGLGFGVGNFTHLRDDQFPDAGQEYAALSDRGTVIPFLAYNSPEKLFAHEVYPDGGILGVGGIAFGVNVIANVATFQADRELKTGQLIGSASASRVQGVYALGAPLLFLRMGPLFSPSSAAYLRAGVGYGVAVTQFDGKLRYRRDGFADVNEHLAHSPTALDAAAVNLFELRIGRWLAQVTSLGFGGRTTRGSYHVGNLALNGGYTFSF